MHSIISHDSNSIWPFELYASFIGGTGYIRKFVMSQDVDVENKDGNCSNT